MNDLQTHKTGEDCEMARSGAVNPESLGRPGSAMRAQVAPVVRIDGLRKTFMGSDGTLVPAVDDVSLTVNPGQFVVLLGPSGCGKTTLLRCIAGLEAPQSGRIEVDGQTVFDSRNGINLPPYRRKLSMVFQSYALWPHMTVRDNITYPLRAQRKSRVPRAEADERAAELMRLVGIPRLGDRYPNQISGGQQQRVAICRALIAGSRLVLFDEPLSNVDAQVRERLRLKLLHLQRQLGFAAVFVTHDRQEAMILANEIAVLEAGKVAQMDSPQAVYSAPANPYVAEFMGPINKVTGLLLPGEGPMRSINTDFGNITGTLPASSTKQPGDEAVALWRPEACQIFPTQTSSVNEMSVAFEEQHYYGSYVEAFYRLGEVTIRATASSPEEHFRGPQTWLCVPAEAVTLA